MEDKKTRKGVTFLIVPDEGGESRSVHLTGTRLRWVRRLGILLASTFFILIVSWGFLAVRAYRSWHLEARVDSLEAERGEVAILAESLARVESEYEALRSLFGSTPGPVAQDLWLPPSGLPGIRSGTQVSQDGQGLPTSWPLTYPGYITQLLVAEGDAEHPGLDVAIPTGSYVRAAGAGRVLRTGEDPLYGRFVVLDHDGGYQTVYGHASEILVERGQTVRRNEVIALSGSTGQSTAPHLHFEVLLDGVPVDPLSMVDQG